MSGPGPLAGLQLRFAGTSHQGLVRPQNQDRLLVRPGLWVVADGMGGHADGAAAASTVIEALEPLADRVPLRREELLTAIASAARAVQKLGSGGPAEPGSTATVLALGREDEGTTWLVANVGDSRTYQRVDGTLRQLTVDHSAVQELVSLGLLDPDRARVDPRRNIITRAIGAGMGADVEVDLVTAPTEVPARFLLCSDGLTNEVDDTALAAVLGAEPDPQRAVDLLVEAALAAGARDNVTVIVVDTVPADIDMAGTSSEGAGSGGAGGDGVSGSGSHSDDPGTNADPADAGAADPGENAGSDLKGIR